MPNTPPESTEQADEHDEDVPVRHVQTVPIRYEDRGDGKGRFHVGITPSIRAAGLDADGMFRFIPEEADELGVVPALGSEEGDGHMRDSRTYSVGYTGSKEDKALRLTIPDDALAALGIEPDPEAAQAGELPLLDVYAGDYMIAFDKSSAISVPTDALPDDYEGEINGEEVILEQAMTTTPLMRSYGLVTAKLTAAIRQAGGENADDLGAVKFHPDRAASLGGVVPATLHEEGDGRSEADMYSLQRVRSNSGAGSMHGFEATIPENVLAALGLSPNDFEDVPLEERPAVTVYAGNRILAFARPREREVAVDREQTPGERPASLTDIEGIGGALAPRLTAAGYETITDLADASREDLLAFDELGEKRADRIMADVSQRMDEQERGDGQ